MIDYTVNAVVVTYNRLELLKQTIECLQKQTYALSKIVIINNASTDGTKEYLASLNDDTIIVKNLKKNTGGAGGFYHGIGIAYAKNCDFVWVMDDDCLCTPTALEELIKAYRGITEKGKRKVGFLCSNARYVDGQPCIMNVCDPVFLYSEFLAEGNIQVFHSSFVAMLIPSGVIKEVGLPYKEYFIWGDDGEYSTRITRKYNGYVVGKSIVVHKMNDNIGVDIFNTPTERIGRFFYFYRNWMFTNKTRSKKESIKFILAAIKLTIRLLLSKSEGRLKKVFTIWKGIFAGLSFKASIDSVDSYIESYGDRI